MHVYAMMFLSNKTNFLQLKEQYGAFSVFVYSSVLTRCQRLTFNRSNVSVHFMTTASCFISVPFKPASISQTPRKILLVARFARARRTLRVLLCRSNKKTASRKKWKWWQDVKRGACSTANYMFLRLTT